MDSKNKTEGIQNSINSNGAISRYNQDSKLKSKTLLKLDNALRKKKEKSWAEMYGCKE